MVYGNNERNNRFKKNSLIIRNTLVDTIFLLFPKSVTGITILIKTIINRAHTSRLCDSSRPSLVQVLNLLHLLFFLSLRKVHCTPFPNNPLAKFFHILFSRYNATDVPLLTELEWMIAEDSR